MFPTIRTDTPEAFIVAPGVYDDPSVYGSRAIGTCDRDTSSIGYSGGFVAAPIHTDEANMLRDEWATREVRPYGSQGNIPNIPYDDLVTLWREQVDDPES